ncbi:MAG TPA: DUF4339 domain-containing protein [Polyangiaceae bacterium]|nr:DUF4339 domain-containing protein [Polyangiaceae bacterium]
MSHYDHATEETEDRFHAQFDSREVKLMTLDELQAAFEAGEIHENTFVCREGDSEWLTLAVVAGLGEEEEEPEPQPVVERRPPMPNRSPVGLETRPPMPQRGPDTGDRRPPMPNRRPDVAPLQSRQVVASAYPSVVPPRIVPSTPLSFAPVTSNINYPDLDLDELSLRPKRRLGPLFGALAAIALIGGGAAFAAKGGLHNFVMPSFSALQSAAGKSQASLTLSNIEAKPSTPAPVAAPVAPTPAPEPVAAVTPPAPSSAPSDSPSAGATPAFSDDMKQALLAADNDRKAKHSSKIKGRAPSAAAHHGGGAPHAAGSSTGFKSGGSAYDPLNGKL